MSGKLAITLIRSLIGRPKDQRLVVAGLGLRKREQTVILPDNPSTRGAAFKIRHMLRVEAVPEEAAVETPVESTVAAPVETAEPAAE